VTEVPEHLLRRSKERRAALGLGGDDTEGAATAAATATTSATPAASPAVVESPAVETAGAGGGGVAVLDEAESAAQAPIPAIPRRPKTPFWMVGLLVVLPIYAFIYYGAFGARHAAAANDPVAAGNAIFHSAGCSGCHGANGEGGVGPAMANVKKTFPVLADQINWVHTGSGPFTGKTYGNSGRVATGGMPAFAGQLTDAQIADVVCYERVNFGGGTQAADCPATAG
jgi:mono/diheme cytochrome c family protein